jgi:hypothetical protein
VITPEIPKVEDILFLMQEAAAKMILSVSLVQRFGWDECYDITNSRQKLAESVGNLIAVFNLLIESEEIDAIEVAAAEDLRSNRLLNWHNIKN